MASSMGGREPVALNTEALQQVTPCLVKLQETCHKAGRKYNKLRGECKALLSNLESLIKNPPPPPRLAVVRMDMPPADVAETQHVPESAADVQEPDVVVNPVKVAGKGIPDVPPTQNAGAEPEKGTADCAEPEESAVEGAVSETSAEDLEARETTPPVPAPAPQAPSSPPESAPNGDVHEDQRSHSPASVEIEGVALGAEDAGTEEATTDVDQADKAAEHPTDSFENHVRLDNAERIGSSAGPDEEAEDGTVTTANSEVPDNSQNQEDAGETPSEAENKEPDAQGSDDTRDNNGCKPTPEQDEVPAHKIKSKLEELRDGEVFADQQPDANVVVAMAIMEVLQSCVSTKRPSIVEVALECLHRLVIYKFVHGQCSVIQGKQAEGDEASPVNAAITPPAVAVELYCKCEDIPDESVELQVMKGLLTCVTSLTVTVHGQALLLAVRCCYNIYLTSRSEVNQATAKASLTQMVNVVFQRMEANNPVVPVSPIVVSDILGVPPSALSDTSSVSYAVQTFLNKVIDDFTVTVDPDAFREGLAYAFDSEHGQDAAVDLEDTAESHDREHIEWRGHEQETLKKQGPGMIAPANHAAAGQDKDATEAEEGAGDAPATPSHKERCPAKEAMSVRGDAHVQQTMVPQSNPSTNVLQKDAYLVFRALCKLSIKTSDGGQGADPMAIKGKVLALELLKVLLENSGPIFCSSDKFTSALKQYLCLSLLKNCAGANAQAQRLSCSLFLTLVRKFRQSLKAEVGVFFPMILLRALEPVGGTGNQASAGQPANVVAAQTAVVLKCLKEQCNDGQLLVDLFVNYDCDLEGSNLFERMLSGLVRTAQGHTPQADSNKQQGDSEALLQTMATECLVSILKSLLVWYKDGAPHPTQEKASEAALDSPDSSMRHPGRHKSAVSLGNLSSAGGDAETNESSPKSSTGTDRGTRQWEVVESKKAYKLGFQEGVALFNKKPKKGVAFMQEQGMIGESPRDIALFLAKTTGLNKTMIGDYLGERDDTCIKVMHAYVDAMDFTGMEFDDAIRKFLADFRLPGEAQKIDRLMEKYAERYFLCNPDSSFKSADVAYVLAFSVIMLNTDAHNPMVKVKMSREGFVNNNRGINDGNDLPADYLCALYDRIINNEIKMKDTELMDSMHSSRKSASSAKSWVDTVMTIIGRKAVDYVEPSDDTIRRTHEEKAKGATFFTATDGETVRPMVEVAWAPMLGAFSVLFETSISQELCTLCLDGFLCAISLTSTLGMTMLRDTFVTSLSRFTSLHAPAYMSLKSVHALRMLIKAAELNGNNFQGAWPEVLRCISKYDLLVQHHSGAPGDNVLFAPPDGLKGSKTENQKPRKGLFGFSRNVSSSHDVGPMSDTDSTMREQREVITSGDKHIFAPQDRPLTLPSVLLSGHQLSGQERARAPGRQKAAQGELMPAPLPRLFEVIDAQELNYIFVNSDRLNSTAIVEFVSALSNVSLEELSNVAHPRVFGLTKIVEIAHFNMTRIRLVWNRIWGVLSDYFIAVGCHQNLSVAIFAVDSLRQLAMKFLERDELANYTFQNDFLRPFVVVMRQSNSLEIRELIIRCVSQMVLARVANVKSGWKSMFMVFTTAAQDDAQTIVRLSFETIEKIVREHFAHITETEITTFTDCVNCLIAFTNNPHSLDVALNAIAFLRFCAMKLADGAIGSVDDLPEAAEVTKMTKPGIKCIDKSTDQSATMFIGSAALISEIDNSVTARTASQGRLHFTDKDEHMYFWFPLLAGLSELTFDPRPDIRYSALEVLFDILRYHGKCFSPSFWARVFDSVIFPIFDHVRAEVTDTTTFTDDRRRADEDKWLYDTCTKCLQHLVDLFCHFFSVVHPMLGRLLDLLAGFIRRTHQSLAAVGVAALVRLISDAGSLMNDAQWVQALQVVRTSAMDTMPQVADLVWHPSSTGDSMEYDGAAQGPLAREWSLSEGLGARRLAEAQCRAAVQLLLVQAAGEVYARHCRRLPVSAAVILLDILRGVSAHARVVDGDMDLRRALAQKQASDGVKDHRAIQDPPLMKLESEASHSYLSVLLHINMAPGSSDTKTSAHIEERLVELCIANLQRYEEVTPYSGGSEQDGASNISMATSSAEHSVRAPLVVATLRALAALGDEEFRRHLHEFFPLLTRLISCQHAPVEVQRALSSLFEKRIGPLLK